ncbi:MAG: VTT domain-containing protein [Phycisphaerales bacterium]
MSDEPPIEADPTDPSKPTGPGLMQRLGPAALLGIAWAVLPAVLGLTLFFEYRGEAAEWLRGHGDVLGIAVYVGIFAVTAGLGLLPTWAQAVIGGYAFGLVGGFGGALAGFVGASVIGYFVARLVARHRVEAEIEANPKAKAARDALVGKGGWRTLLTVTMIRFPPNSPFALTNGLMATTEVPFGAYLLGTAVGMAPRTLAGVWIGTSVETMDEIDMPGWMKYGGIAVMFVVLIVLGQIAQRAVEKKIAAGEIPADDEPSEPRA